MAVATTIVALWGCIAALAASAQVREVDGRAIAVADGDTLTLLDAYCARNPIGQLSAVDLFGSRFLNAAYRHL